MLCGCIMLKLVIFMEECQLISWYLHVSEETEWQVMSVADDLPLGCYVL
jgi:hypothetical protein